MVKRILKIGILTAVLVSIFLSFSFKTNETSESLLIKEEHCYTVPTLKEVVQDIANKNIKPYPLLGKTYTGFKEALGFKESRGDYFVINKFGYLGKYQFSLSTLNLIGIDDSCFFISTPRLQENAFNAHISRNKWILRRDIKRSVGKKIKGIRVTESGILAAAHLAGAGNVKKFLRSSGTIDFADAFGTQVSNYLKKFSGYDTSNVLPNRFAKVNI